MAVVSRPPARDAAVLPGGGRLLGHALEFGRDPDLTRVTVLL